MTKTHTMRSRLISLVLVLVMVLGCLPLSALADDTTPTSSFTKTWTSGDFRVQAELSDGYTLQTVSGSNPTQNTKLDLTIVATKEIANEYSYIYIALIDSEGKEVRRVMWNNVKVEEDTSSGSSTYKFTKVGTVFSHVNNVNDPSALQPKVVASADEKYAYINGVAYTVEGAGTFPVYAQVGYQVNGEAAVTLPAERIGTFNIASYSDDVMTKNLTFNLDATDAYYAYSTVAMVANENYKLPTVTPIREHYEFKGWKLDDTTTYQPGDTISYTETNKDLMLTAVWELDQVTVDYPDTLPTGVAYGDTTPTDGDVDYGSVQSFDLVLDAGYDPNTLFVTANDVLLAPVNYVAGTDGKVTYTYSFTATADTTVEVSDDLAKLSYVVTMPVGHFTAKLTGTGITSEASTTVEYGGSYSFTVTPEKGYEIVGVYVNGDELTANAGVYTVKDVKTAQKVEVLVEAIPNYTVTYVVNDKQYTTQVVADGEKVAALPEAPVVTGYEFVSWNTKQDGTGDEFNATTAVSGNITVYAQLTAKTYTITYNSNGGSDTVTEMPASGTTKTYGQPVQLNTATPSREGYTFLGWSRNENATEATYAAGDYFTEEITTATTLYAVWKANTYTITLPTGTGYTVVTTQETVVAWDEDFTFDVVVDRGYVETAPVVKANDAPLTATSSAENPDGSKTYSYTIENIQENQVVSITVGKNKTYPVIFYVQDTDTPYATQQVEYGYYAARPEPPVVEGYTFLGWTEDLNVTPVTYYNFNGTPVTDEVRLYADLEKITYTVNLPDSTDGYTVSPADQTVDWNGSQEFTVTVKEGYSDANMVVSANGTPLYPIGKNDSTYTYKIFNIKADQEVYVVGVERKTVTITYNDNGGVGGPTQQVANYYVATASDNSEVSAIEPTRDGYVFQGWARTNTATADDVVYKSGETGKDTLTETTDTTLYAVWARAEREVTLTVEPNEQFEGSEVTLTATVSSGGTGSVLFYRSETDTASGGTLVGTSAVSGDKATATVVVKNYAADAATDYFYAVFKPTDGAGYQESTSATVGITVRSTAITWGVDAGKAQSKLEIAGETDGNDNMIAGQQYTLTIPSVYALDDDTTPVTDYTVTWEKKTADGDWAQIANADGASYIVTAYEEGDQYRAKLTPTDPYNKAVNNPTNVSYTATLVTGETEEAVKQATEIALTVTDTNNLADGTLAEFEGQDVTLTASVTYDGKAVTEGSVQFYLNREEIGQPVAVNAETGEAVLTWTTSKYEEDIDSYTAKYLGTATYDESETAAAEVVTIRSTAISWKLDNNSIAKGANQLTIKETVDDQTNTVTEMVAGHTYTLELPDVYALDNMNVVISEYTVTWQKKDAQQDWVTVADAGDTYTVTSYKVGDEYRAVVTPADPYTKAQAYNTDGTLADGYVKTLIAGTGVTVDLQPTTTTLKVSDTHDIPAQDDSIVAEFEGQKVTLTATVVDDDGKPVTTGFVQFGRPIQDGTEKIGEPVAVNGDNGTAVLEVTIDEYKVGKNDVFVAAYLANETYAGSTSVPESVLIRSTAIAWTADGNALNVYTGDSTDEDDLLSDEAEYYLYANRTYTLQLPAVQEDGQDSVTLKNDVDYTVTWYEIDGSGNATIIPTASGDTCVVTPSQDNMQYFAVVYPKTGSNYTDAYENGAYTTHLTTAQTGNSQRATTVTTLDITNVLDRGDSAEPRWEQYEGIEITLTANVKVEDPAKPGTGLASPVISQGTVTFYVIMSEDVEAVTATPKQIAKVSVTDGMAETTYVLPECTLADALHNIEYFYAVYQDSSDNAQGTVTYQSSNSTDDAGEMDITKIVTSLIPADDQVQILSTAISWALNNDVITTDGNTIAIYEGDGTTTPLTGNMVATETYTLALPAVYAYNDADDDNLTDKALTVNVDYHVDWQYLDNGMSDWTTLGAASQDTYLITSHVEGRVYRAVVTPIYDQESVTQYKTAAKYDENDKVQNLHFTELYTDPTAPTDLKDTTTDLAITGTDHEPAAVWINGEMDVFEDDHYTQFAGQTVTLKATVTEAGSDVLVGTGKVYFYRYVDGTNDVKLNDTAVDVNNGIAEYTVTISDYNAKNSVTANVDKFYAVYETNNTYKTSASTAVDEGVYAAPTELTDLVYIKSTIIDIPVITSLHPGVVAGKDGEQHETTKALPLTGLQSGIKHTFTLKDSAGAADATADYSVVALDGRVVDPANYTFEWFTNTGTGEEEITSAATNELLTDITKVDDTFHIHLVAQGDMTGGLRQDGTTIADFAESQNAVIGELQNVKVTVTASDEIDATEDTDVYQRNDITLTAEVVPAMDDATMQPTGTVTFYYSVDNGGTWTEISEHVALALNQVTNKMEAVLITDILPVAAETNTKQDVVITAIYSGDSSFETSGTYDPDAKTVTDTVVDNVTEPVVDDTVTVYSSVVYVNSNYENKQQFVLEDSYEKEQGIIATVIGDRFAATETATLKLQPVYTLDYADDVVGDTIAKLTYSQDYTIQWQQLPNAGAYTPENIGTASGWQNLTGESNGTCRITVQQGYAYRAVITVKDADPVRASYEEFEQEIAGRQVYYSNIIMAGDGDLTLNVAVTTEKSEADWEGIVQGEEVTFHTLMSGATGLTPIANVEITVTDKADKTVFSDNENNVNGNVRFEWTPTVPGYYTVTVKATPTNGYAEKTITKEIIVRDNDYQINVTGTSKTYNGSTLGADVEIANMDIEAALAAKSWTVTYTDAEGNKVEPTQAGEYDYVVTLPASAYWTEKTMEGTFTIEKRQVSVADLVAQAKVYDGTTNVNLLEIVLDDAETAQSTTGLPSNNWGVINGDSLYAVGTGYTASANAGNTKLGVKDVELKGDDAHNYVLNSTSYTEDFNIQRNQLQGDVADATYQYTGSSITVPADDIYLIDQQGNVVTDYTVTYYYHNGEGVEKVEAMKDLGMYTIVVNKDPANYKGGASQIVYVSNAAQDAAPSKDFESATVDITNTVELYGESTGIVATASTGAVSKIAYRVGTEWTTTVPINAGRYLVKVTTSTDDVAYGLYTIVKARPEVTLTVGETTVVYDSSLHTGNPSTTSSGNGEVYYSYAGDVVIGYHDDVNVDYQGQHDVGTYVVTAHVGETDNYTAHEVSKTFEITPKALTITADDLQRQQYGAYPDMVASYDGLATDDNKAVDTSLRDVMIQPEFSTDWDNFAQDHVGTYIIKPVGYLVKNYVVTPVDGQYTVTATDPQPYLAIHGLPDNGTNTENIVYYDDVIQLYPYGNQVNDVVNGSSAIAWSVDNTSVADITHDGKLTIVGVGDFTITLTRGTGDEKISTTVSVTALKKEVKVIVPNEDVVYSGTEQTYSEDAFAVDAYKIDETEPVTSINLADTTRTEIGSQIVKGNVPETETLYQSETYGGRFTINDKEINIEPVGKDTVYGTKVEGLTYREVTPVGGVPALTYGFAVSVADVYDNLDVLDGYEILVAGRENINYNVKYVTDQTAEDVQVTEKALTIKTGSYADTVGKTGGSLNPAGDYPVNGAIVDPTALFETDGMRMYGEPNQVMGFVLETLIDGDSVADVNALLDWLVEFDIDDHHLIDEDANRYYSATGPTDNWINEGGRAEDYYISTEMKFRNYTENVIRGTQNIYQRPVTLSLADGVTTPNAYFDITMEDLIDALEKVLVAGKYNGEGGLADLLNHTIKDLDLQFEFTTEDGKPWNGTESYVGTLHVKVTVGNLNYWLANPFVFDVELLPYKYVVEYNSFTATSATVTLYKVDKDGNRKAAYLPVGVDLVGQIFTKLSDGATYDDYVASGVYKEYTMVKNNYVTGRYTVTYPRLTGNYRFYATVKDVGYNIISQ